MLGGTLEKFHGLMDWKWWHGSNGICHWSQLLTSRIDMACQHRQSAINVYYVSHIETKDLKKNVKGIPRVGIIGLDTLHTDTNGMLHTVNLKSSSCSWQGFHSTYWGGEFSLAHVWSTCIQHTVVMGLTVCAVQTPACKHTICRIIHSLKERQVRKKTLPQAKHCSSYCTLPYSIQTQYLKDYVLNYKSVYVNFSDGHR